MSTRVANPVAADFRAVARADAGLFTFAVNYPASARLASFAFRRGVRPTALTVANLVLGVGASLAVLAAGHRIVEFHVAAGVLAWLLWQSAYCLDCADGQLWVMGIFAVVNSSFLAASIVQAAVSAWRSSGPAAR